MEGEVDGRDVAVRRVLSAAPWQTIVLGEAPSRTSDALSPLLGGRSGRFLAELAGLPPHRFATLFRCVNLLPAFPGADKRRRMRAAGAGLRVALDGHRAILLGRLVAGALGAGRHPLLAWGDVGLTDVLVAPHPSGENRAWDDALRKRVGDMLRAEAARAAEGMLLELAEAGAALPWLRALVDGQSSSS